jgi:HEAT repeat protein
MAGHRGDVTVARALVTDDDPGVRATALAALARAGDLSGAEVAAGLADAEPTVRRRACEVAAGPGAPRTGWTLTGVLGDDDPTVVEVAAWAAGEIDPPEAGTVATLAALTTGHGDGLVREAAAAALGAVGDPAGLSAVLAACTDKATVRRRAVLALAAFDGPEVEAALRGAATDRDRQVRQAAEDLLAGWGT